MSTMDLTTANALANEARKATLRIAVAEQEGRVANASAAIQILSSQASDADRSLQRFRAELVRLEAGAGPGVTDDFGHRPDIINSFLEKAVEAGLLSAEQVPEFRALI